MKPVVHRYNFPQSEPPVWADRIDRWYQMDPFSFGLTDLAARFAMTKNRPESMILSCPDASNESDWDFAQQAESPQKFAHTLPNIRLSPMLQVLEWSGPILCLVKGAASGEVALEEAQAQADSEGEPVWLWEVQRVKQEVYESRLTVVEPGERR